MTESADTPRQERSTPPPRDYTSIAPSIPDGDFDLRCDGAEVCDIEVEIGFGRGMFLFERAAAAPGNRVYGFEIKKKWAYLVAERTKVLGLGNAHAFGGDIREILPRLGPDGSVARVFMHFPDPWWKKRHAKRRLLSGDLLKELARLLRPGGEFYLQTDVEERAAGYVEALEEHADFVFSDTGAFLESNPYGASSNREVRAIDDGLPVFRVLAHRA